MESNPSPHRERLVAPGLWWVAVCLPPLCLGWLLLVATTPAFAVATAVISLLALAAGLWRYGAVLVTAGPGVLRAGEANLAEPDLGEVRPLDPAAWRAALDRAGTDRAFLLTRPWIDRGVRVEVADPGDPTPYWLVSSRRPSALADAVRHTGATDERNTDGEEASSEDPT